MAWHIFKKDWRLLRPFALALVALECLWAILPYGMDRGKSEPKSMIDLLVLLLIVGSGFLIVGVVQLDALPGVRQDWLVRPIRRIDLLKSKLLFVLLGQASFFLAEFAKSKAEGISWESALSSSFSSSCFLLIAFCIPVLALASATSTFAEALVGIAMFAGMLLLLTVAWGIPLPSNLIPKEMQWISLAANFTILASGAVAIVAIQYLHRNTLAAWSLAFMLTVVCWMSYLIPFGQIVAIQQRLSPKPGAGAPIQLAVGQDSEAFANASPFSSRVVEGIGFREPHREFSMRIRISGIPADTVLHPDMVIPKLILEDGTTMNLSNAWNIVTGDPASRWEHGNLVNTGRDDERIAYTYFYLPEHSIPEGPTRLQIEYAFTLLRLSESHSIPAVTLPQAVPGVGQCGANMSPTGSGVDVQCVETTQQQACVSYFLENPSTGAQNPPMTKCSLNYSPILILPAMARFDTFLPFRNLNGGPFAVYANSVDEARVVMRVHKVEDHFVKSIVIPDVRLNDWAGR